MKILYGIQGTGNGHLSRAKHLIPILQQYGQVDTLVSGTQSQIDLPYPITYRRRGLSFHYNSKGGIHYPKTVWQVFTSTLKYEVLSLPIKQYDLVINDFEPVTAWAAKLKKVPSVALSHQAAFLSRHSPRPKRKDIMGELILKHYAPTKRAVGFHFKPYDSFIFPPVIREDIQHAYTQDKGFVIVYLPAFNEQRLFKLLGQVPKVDWQVFSRYTQQDYRIKNIWVRPVESESFMEGLLNCSGVLTSSGFETPSEALYLGKKLLSVPIQGQYEQQCNAVAMEELGVSVVRKVKNDFPDILRDWVWNKEAIHIPFEDKCQEAVSLAINGNHDPHPDQFAERQKMI